MSVRVAVVDDDAGFRRVAVLLLTARGYEVVGQAGDIRSGYEVIADARPDAALIDWRLPDGTGAELLAKLAELPSPPRVLITSSETEAGSDPRVAGAFVPKERLAEVDLGVYLRS